MPITSLLAKFRPVRVGFVVRAGSIPDLIAAAEINTLLWGGIRNPILPVAKPKPGLFAERLNSLFQPDAFYRVDDASELHAFTEKHPYVRDPSHIAEEIFYEDWKSKKLAVAYLDVLNVVLELDRRHRRDAIGGWGDAFASPRWDVADPLSAMFSLQFGRYPTNRELKDDFQEAFSQGLGAKEVTIVPGEALDGSLGRRVPPIGLTGVDLSSYGGSIERFGFFLGDPNSFEDLLSFWNIRAAGAALMFLPIDDVARTSECVRAFVDSLGLGADDANHPIRGITAFHHCPDNKAMEALDGFGFGKKVWRWRMSEEIWNGLNIVPASVSFDWQRATGTVEQQYDRWVINLSLPQKKFLGENIEHRVDVGNQSIAVSLESFRDAGHRGHSLRVPNIPGLNEWYSRELAFNPWKVRVERNGIALLIKANDEDATLFPIEHGAIVGRVLTFAKVTNEMSQPGRLAAKIISGMRDYDPLEACRVFKIRGVRRLIKALRFGTPMTLSELKRAVWMDGDFTKYQGLYIEQRDAPKLRPADVVTFLLKKNILRPRLRARDRLLRRKVEIKLLWLRSSD